MVKMLSEKYGMIVCGENYHTEITSKVAEEKYQPDLCYIPNLKDWKDFVTRTPEEYARWVYNIGNGVAVFEEAELIRLAGENPEKVMENYKAGLAKINSQENYDMFINSGLFVLVRENPEIDTKDEVLEKLSTHFGLI